METICDKDMSEEKMMMNIWQAYIAKRKLKPFSSEQQYHMMIQLEHHHHHHSYHLGVFRAINFPKPNS
ncbi:hypothetical protein BLA29_011243 [Euroglyphus maynei]|uniref:Uncharacterized protein n=1 Tax=Euroglyphus maynei TaxID=6958 RepID=A0A1Y3BKT7_EURMA|nr:hypothetical protein BLA29_011243 [Euroglyphus maynei]